MLKLKIHLTILLILIFFKFNLLGQSFSLSGGIKPNNLEGKHIAFLIKKNIKRKFSLSVEYRMVKYVDNFFDNKNEPEPGFHKEYKNDKTFISFQELNRGYVFKDNSEEFRAKDFNHSFSTYAGYDFLKNKNFILTAMIGPHISFSRYVTYYYNSNAIVQINFDSEILNVPYFDYAITRTWDLGLGTRIDAQYLLFKNLSVGINSSIKMDFFAESIDLVYGALLSIHF